MSKHRHAKYTETRYVILFIAVVFGSAIAVGLAF